jgi:hypothetical protein
MSAMAEVIKALVDRLKADAGVGALIGDRIWEGSAPTGTAKPFVTVDNPTESTRFTLGGTGFSDTVLLHVNSGLDSPIEFATLIPAINAALATSLNLGALGSVRLKYETGTILLDGSGRTAPLRYRAFAMAA